MGQRIEERFVVRAPVEKVWAYLVDPRRVVTCLPGAELTEVVDERTFHGAVKVKVGPVTVSYKGKVILEEVDDAARRVRHPDALIVTGKAAHAGRAFHEGANAVAGAAMIAARLHALNGQREGVTVNVAKI